MTSRLADHSVELVLNSKSMDESFLVRVIGKNETNVTICTYANDKKTEVRYLYATRMCYFSQTKNKVDHHLLNICRWYEL